MASGPARMREKAAVALIAAGLVLVGYGAYIPIKAQVAQVLLQRAWAAAPKDGPAPRPWPWADTWPVARIEVPKLDASAIVLEGAHGRSLPFGPGHVEGTAAPGLPGHSVVAAHRDTHFAFLRHVGIGQEIWVERPGGAKSRYVVVDLRVLDTRKETIYVDDSLDILTLVTCYPFTDWEPGGPLRYVVTAAGMPNDV